MIYILMQLSIVSNSTLKTHELLGNLHLCLEFMQVMIEEMQEQEAEFLKEQKEKKLKNRRLSAWRLSTQCSIFRNSRVVKKTWFTNFQGDAFFLQKKRPRT